MTALQYAEHQKAQVLFLWERMRPECSEAFRVTGDAIESDLREVQAWMPHATLLCEQLERAISSGCKAGGPFDDGPFPESRKV